MKQHLSPILFFIFLLTGLSGCDIEKDKKLFTIFLQTRM